MLIIDNKTRYKNSIYLNNYISLIGVYKIEII